MKDVSIIIVNYNTPELTVACVKSIFKCEKNLNFEIILIDNGSYDQSVEKLEKLEKEYKNLFFIKNSSNLGFSKANNIGIKEAKSKYIFLLNSDTEIKANAISELLEFAKNTKDVGVVGSRLLNSDGSLQPSCFVFPTIRNAIKEYWFGEEGYFSKFAPEGDISVEVNALVGAAFLITPTAIKKVGLLDERYFMYFEDLDYCKRVHKAGLKVFYNPKSIVVHHHGASGRNLAKGKDQWKRLIPSSKIYHGLLGHYLIYLISLSGQKWKKLSS